VLKVFEYCILNHYGDIIYSADNEFGFKKSLDCSHAIYAVRRIIEYFTRYASIVNLCAIDLSKAFDKVNLQALFIKLMNRNIPVELLSVIEVLCSDCFTCVKWFDAWSIPFKINFGVRQGSVLAPYLFALYLDDLANWCSPEQGCFVILYADDILLISPSVVGLELLLHRCELEFIWLDMAINF